MLHWFRSGEQVATKFYAHSLSIKCDLTLLALLKLSFYWCLRNPIQLINELWIRLFLPSIHVESIRLHKYSLLPEYDGIFEKSHSTEKINNHNSTFTKKKISVFSPFYEFKNENSFATAFNYLRNVLIAFGIT